MSNEDSIKQALRNELKEEDISEEDIKECLELVDLHYHSVDFSGYDLTLDKATVKGFKQISEPRTITPQSENFIAFGENSQGKTSIFQALLFNLAGLPDPQKRMEYDLTEVVNKGSDSANTEVEWKIGGEPWIIQRMVQGGRGKPLKQYDRPRIHPVEDNQNEFTRDSRTEQAVISRKIGIGQLTERNFDRFHVLFLYFLFSIDFRAFMDWTQSSDMIDVLLGVNLTRVIKASDGKMEEEYPIEKEDREAKNELPQKRGRIQRLEKEIPELEREKEMLQNHLANTLEELDALEQSDGEERASRLRSQRNNLESQEATYSRKLQQQTNRLAQINRLLNRYEDADLKEDVKVVGDRMEQSMSVPRRCPVCTRKVTEEDKQQLHHDHNCPLCRKNVPKKRLKIEREYEPDESITQIEEGQVERRDELVEQQDQVKARIEELEQDRENVRESLSEIESVIEDETLTTHVEHLEELESERNDLRRELADVQGQLDAKRNEIEALNEDIDELERRYQRFQEHNKKRDVLTTFNRIIRRYRNEERRELQNGLKETMESLLPLFEDGLFSSAETVTFPNEDSYKFVVNRRDEHDLDSRTPSSNTAEIVLHSLLFHTALLKQLTKTEGRSPLNLFIIDSPFSNSQSTKNQGDIARLLSKLPEVLNDVQILLAMADVGHAPEELGSKYRVQRFDENQ